MYRAVFFALVLAGTAHADDSDAPVRYHHHGMTVIMHSSMKPIDVVIGDNPIDKLHTFVCKSAAGCVVATSLSLLTDAFNTSSCSYVDGIVAAPGCGADPINAIVVRQQQAKVTAGTHSVQSKMTAFNAGKITGWEVQYTIYERKVKGAD